MGTCDLSQLNMLCYVMQEIGDLVVENNAHAQMIPSWIFRSFVRLDHDH